MDQLLNAWHYTLSVRTFLSVGLFWLAFPLVLGFVRLVILYASAAPLDSYNPRKDASNSSFIARCILWVSVKIFNVKDRNLDLGRPIGVHPAGIFIDSIMFFLSSIFICLIWPALLAIFLLWLPIESLHRYNVKKKEFIAKLKGEHAKN